MPQLTYEYAKPCGYSPCSVILYRRPKEGPKHFRERQSCSRSHGMLMRRPALPTSKVCKACGATFTRPASCSHARWEAQEHCSKLCACRGVAGANRIPDEKRERKVCALDGCDVVFVRDPQRCTLSRWKRRRFCGKPHADENARRKAAAWRAEKPPTPRKRTRSGSPRERKPPPPPPGAVDTPPRPVFAGPPPTEVWRPAVWAGRDIRPKIPMEV